MLVHMFSDCPFVCLYYVIIVCHLSSTAVRVLVFLLTYLLAASCCVVLGRGAELLCQLQTWRRQSVSEKNGTVAADVSTGVLCQVPHQWKGLSVCLSVSLSVCEKVSLSVCVCLSVCLSVKRSLCLWVCLSVCVSVSVCVTGHCCYHHIVCNCLRAFNTGQTERFRPSPQSLFYCRSKFVIGWKAPCSCRCFFLRCRNRRHLSSAIVCLSLWCNHWVLANVNTVDDGSSHCTVSLLIMFVPWISTALKMWCISAACNVPVIVVYTKYC